MTWYSAYQEIWIVSFLRSTIASVRQDLVSLIQKCKDSPRSYNGHRQRHGTGSHMTCMWTVSSSLDPVAQLAMLFLRSIPICHAMRLTPGAASAHLDTSSHWRSYTPNSQSSHETLVVLLVSTRLSPHRIKSSVIAATSAIRSETRRVLSQSFPPTLL